MKLPELVTGAAGAAEVLPQADSPDQEAVPLVPGAGDSESRSISMGSVTFWLGPRIY